MEDKSHTNKIAKSFAVYFQPGQRCGYKDGSAGVSEFGGPNTLDQSEGFLANAG